MLCLLFPSLSFSLRLPKEAKPWVAVQY
jgi:hypothetical protein